MLLPYRLPRPLRIAAYAVAVAILLYMCLAPSDGLPKVKLWDKEEHAISWFVLTATGLILSPRRPKAIATFALGLGVFVEIVQGLMGFGRDADIHDVYADSIGIVAAFIPYFLIVLYGARKAAPVP
jgi:VanZ family protein